MTDTTQHPEALAFCWATELAMTQQPVTLSVTEAREVSAGMQRLHTENAAARLEIKSLQARIKAMAEEHTDELMVAHLDGRMRAAQPAGAQQPGAIYAVYAELPDERAAFEARFPVPGGVSWNGSEYVVKDDYLNSYRCDRFVGQWAAWQARASHGQAPAQHTRPCVVCGSDEPFTGTCGSGDPRALCKQPTSAQAADRVQEDAACWRWLAEYLVGTRTDLDDEIVASETVNDLRKLVKAAIKQGASQ